MIRLSIGLGLAVLAAGCGNDADSPSADSGGEESVTTETSTGPTSSDEDSTSESTSTATTDPVTTDPVTTDPATTDPVTTDPVTTAEDSSGNDPTAGECTPVDGDALPAGTPCDPLGQTCAAGGCYFQEPAGGCTFECIETSGPGIAEGGVCLYLNDCAPGLGCVDASPFFASCAGEYCCAPFCDLDAPACTNGGECVSFFAPFPTPAGFENIGVCATGG